MHSRTGIWAAVAVRTVVMGGLCGCSDDGTVEVSVNSPAPNGGVLTTRSRELTPQAGQKLLRDIQRNPKRLEKLTPPEKRFLARAAEAKAIRQSEEDAGR